MSGEPSVASIAWAAQVLRPAGRSAGERRAADAAAQPAPRGRGVLSGGNNDIHRYGEILERTGRYVGREVNRPQLVTGG
ncbi:hypothetical protein [Micromonospora profundi]|uniref:hypothetical protein n=1 Tax=Micromonospora profundi TaxID=1420889 RepID=UPI003659AD1E